MNHICNKVVKIKTLCTANPQQTQQTLQQILSNKVSLNKVSPVSNTNDKLHSLASVFPWEHLHLHNCVHGRSADLQLHLFVLQSFLHPHFTRSRQLSASLAIVIQTGCHWFSFFCQPNKEADGNEAWSSKDVAQIPVWYTLLFGHIELFLDVVYNIALIVVVSRCSLLSTLENLRTSTQMLMKLGQCYF